MSSQRAQRVAETIHKEISSMLIKGLKDPRIGFVTLTSVDVSGDLRNARVYYTVFGEQEQKDLTQTALEKATPFIRRELGKRLRLRCTPELKFCFDASLEYGNRIESLLKELNDHDPESD